MLISFLFLHENICCGYSLEAPRRGASNEYPQHMISWRNKKNIMWIPSLICSYGYAYGSGKENTQMNIFLMSWLRKKRMLWVLIRSTSVSTSVVYPQCMFSWRSTYRKTGLSGPVGGCRFDPRRVGNILSWRFDHETFSTVILCLPLIFSSPELCSGWAIVITFRPSFVRPSVR